MRAGNRNLPCLFLVTILTLAGQLETGRARAQSPAGHGDTPLPLTLEEALERAQAVSPRLGELAAELAAEEAAGRRARAERRPDVDVTAGYTRLSTVPELTIPAPGGSGRLTLFPDIRNSYTSRLALELPLYTGGRIRSGIDAAARRAEAARDDLAAGRADLRLEVTETYWTLVIRREQQRVLKEAIAAFDAHLTDAENRVRFGLAARNEVLAVRVERERAELARLEAEEAERRARAALARLLDLPPEVEVEAVEPLATPPPPEEDAEALVAHALAARPERAALVERLAASELAVEARRGGLRPSLGLAAGIDLARPNPRILPRQDELDDTWDVSLLLTYRLFDGGKTEADVAVARARAEAVRQLLTAVDRHIREEVTVALAGRTTARGAAAVAEANRASAQENVRVARDRFRQGLIPSSELLDAETALLEADLDHTAALARLRLVEARLDRAVGR